MISKVLLNDTCFFIICVVVTLVGVCLGVWMIGSGDTFETVKGIALIVICIVAFRHRPR